MLRRLVAPAIHSSLSVCRAPTTIPRAANALRNFSRPEAGAAVLALQRGPARTAAASLSTAAGGYRLGRRGGMGVMSTILGQSPFLVSCSSPLSARQSQEQQPQPLTSHDQRRGHSHKDKTHGGKGKSHGGLKKRFRVRANGTILCKPAGRTHGMHKHRRMRNAAKGVSVVFAVSERGQIRERAANMNLAKRKLPPKYQKPKVPLAQGGAPSEEQIQAALKSVLQASGTGGNPAGA